MGKVLLCVLATYVIAGAACATSRHVTVNPSLGAVLQKLSLSAPAADVEQIEQAIRASPALLGQLNDLASSGKLKSITMEPGKTAVVKGHTHFGAAFSAKEILLADAFLKKQSSMASDVHVANEILPNNTVFLLGHLAYHLRDAQFVARAIRHAPNKGAFLNAVMRYEGAAFIQGWNDVVSAATRANGNKPLSNGQVGELILNLRYRAAFIKAMSARDGKKLEFSKGGRVAASKRNVSAMGAVLRSTPVAGVE